MPYIVLYRNKERLAFGNKVLLKNKRLREVKKLRIIDVVSDKTAKYFLEYFVNYSTKRAIYIPKHLLNQEMIRLVNAYNLELVVSPIIRTTKSLLKFAYDLMRDAVKVTREYALMHKFLFEHRSMIPFSIINNFARGYFEHVHYQDISAAYPSSFKKEMPGSLTSRRTDMFLALVDVGISDYYAVTKDAKVYLIKRSRYAKQLSRQIIASSELLAYFDDFDVPYEVKHVWYFEPVDLYDIYRKAMYLRSKGEDKVVVNSMAFGFFAKKYLPVGIYVAQRILTHMLKMLAKYEDCIYDIYVDAIYACKQLPSVDSMFAYKHEERKNILLAREGIVAKVPDRCEYREFELLRAKSYYDLYEHLYQETKMYAEHLSNYDLFCEHAWLYPYMPYQE